MRKLFDAADLPAGGSVRFELKHEDELAGHSNLGFGPAEGFAIRDPGGSVRAYLNKCPHRAEPVALGDGKLYARDGTLECQAHGAYFDPATGRCVRGPCEGDSLRRLPVEEHQGVVWLLEGELAPVPLTPREKDALDWLEEAAEHLADGDDLI